MEPSHIVFVGFVVEGPPVTAISRGGCSNSTGCSSGSAGTTGNISGIISAASSGSTHLENVVDYGQDAWSLTTDVFTISRNGSRCSFTTGVAFLVRFAKAPLPDELDDDDDDDADDEELDVDFDEAPKVTLGD